MPTTPLLPEVLAAMQECMSTNYANPSSLHALGRQSRHAVETSREVIAQAVNAHPSQLLFTSGGTEANNLAIKGCIAGMGITSLAYSAIEHPSVRDIARSLASSIDVTELAVNYAGEVSLDVVEDYCINTGKLALLSIMLANNETGSIQDLAGLSIIARQHGHLVHTDAVQALGKIEVDFKALGINLMSLSAHKIHGPKGIGALIYDKALIIKPLLHGGGQERDLRSGTENIAAIVGFAKAAELSQQRLVANRQKIEKLRHYLEQELIKVPGSVLFAKEAHRLPNTTFFGFPGIDGETLLMQLDSSNIAVTSGSACASKSGKPSHVLLAMGINEHVAQSAIRISLGFDNTKAEVDQLIKVLSEQVKMLRNVY